MNQKAEELFRAGILLAQQGKLRKSIDSFREAIRIEPDSIEPHGHLAYAYFNYGWLSHAIREYQFLIDKGHETAEIHLLLSDIYFLLSKPSESKNHREIAEKLDFSFCKNYMPHRTKHKSVENQLMEAIFKTYRYMCYFVDLVFVLIIEFWKRNIMGFYKRPWSCQNSIQISLFRILRFLKKYQPAFLEQGPVYYRNIEFPISLNWVVANPGSRIIDIGAGVSTNSAIFLKYNCEVYITDGDSYVLELKKFFQGTDLESAIASDKLHIEVADATKLPYPDNYFDRIISIGAIEHIPADGDKLAMKEIFRVLKKEGIAVVTLEAAEHYREEFCKINYYMGVQYFEESEIKKDTNLLKSSDLSDFSQKKLQGENPDFLLFVRSYDDTGLKERIIVPSGLELLEFGYFGDFIPLRIRFEDTQRYHLFKSFWRHFQPALASLFYWRFNSSEELENIYNPIVYVVLKKL